MPKLTMRANGKSDFDEVSSTGSMEGSTRSNTPSDTSNLESQHEYESPDAQVVEELVSSLQTTSEEARHPANELASSSIILSPRYTSIPQSDAPAVMSSSNSIRREPSPPPQKDRCKEIIDSYRSTSFIGRCLSCFFTSIRSEAMRNLKQLAECPQQKFTKENIQVALHKDSRRLRLFNQGGEGNNTGTDLVIKKLSNLFKANTSL